MNKWLAKFVDASPEDRTDKPDILPVQGTMSGMSGPLSKSPGENAPPVLDNSSRNGTDKPDILPPLALVIEPAAPNGRPIYFEGADGRILGPAQPEFLAMSEGQFWVVVSLHRAPRRISADRLRSRQAFESQTEPRETELIR